MIPPLRKPRLGFWIDCPKTCVGVTRLNGLGGGGLLLPLLIMTPGVGCWKAYLIGGACTGSGSLIGYCIWGLR